MKKVGKLFLPPSVCDSLEKVGTRKTEDIKFNEPGYMFIECGI